MRKSLKTIFIFIYHWCGKNFQTSIGRELGLSKNTIVDWSYCLREVCQAIFLFSDIKFGGIDDEGNPRIVEIDESLFF